MKVEVMYEIMQVTIIKIIEITGPSCTNPCGYEKGPVASTRLTTVEEAWRGVMGTMGTEGLVGAEILEVVIWVLELSSVVRWILASWSLSTMTLS
jgi:hypothetical protein